LTKGIIHKKTKKKIIFFVFYKHLIILKKPLPYLFSFVTFVTIITISEAIATIIIVKIDFHSVYAFTMSQTESKVINVIIIIERIKIPIAIFLIDEFIFKK